MFFYQFQCKNLEKNVHRIRIEFNSKKMQPVQIFIRALIEPTQAQSKLKNAKFYRLLSLSHSISIINSQSKSIFNLRNLGDLIHLTRETASPKIQHYLRQNLIN